MSINALIEVFNILDYALYICWRWQLM